MSDDGDDDVRSFFLKPPVSQEELEQVVPVVEARLEQVLQRVEGEDDILRFYQEFLQQEKNSLSKENSDSTEVLTDMEDRQLDPRSYQQALLERAKTENIIVHLGTGAG